MLEVLKNLLAAALTEEAIKVWLPFVISSLVTLVGVLVFKSKLDTKNKLFLAGLELASQSMSAIAPKTANTVDDKIAYGLKVLNDHFNQAGKTLPPADVAKAERLFKAMHGVTPEKK